jgi:hypothetical protein
MVVGNSPKLLKTQGCAGSGGGPGLRAWVWWPEPALVLAGREQFGSLPGRQTAAVVGGGSVVDQLLYIGLVGKGYSPLTLNLVDGAGSWVGAPPPADALDLLGDGPIMPHPNGRVLCLYVSDCACHHIYGFYWASDNYEHRF